MRGQSLESASTFRQGPIAVENSGPPGPENAGLFAFIPINYDGFVGDGAYRSHNFLTSTQGGAKASMRVPLQCVALVTVPSVSVQCAALVTVQSVSVPSVITAGAPSSRSIGSLLGMLSLENALSVRNAPSWECSLLKMLSLLGTLPLGNALS
jgi:hypothetical protein